MESKKELGMGWYEFLRYFPFGIMRIINDTAQTLNLVLPIINLQQILCAP